MNKFDKDLILTNLNKQRQFVNNGGIKDVNYRIKLLKLLKKNIKLFENELYESLKQDLNKSKEESYMTEIGLVLHEINYMIKHCKEFSRKQLVPTPLSNFPAISYKKPCPYGSVLVISPWNYPVLLSLDPLVEAISAGNAIVLKPSEISPNVSNVLEKLIKATFKVEEVQVVLGDKEVCSFLLDQDFDYIFYTGSTRVGAIVMQKAAEHFTPVTLELGGKSPCIVDDTANIKLAAKRIIFGKMLNAGQTCVAPDYIYCHKSVKNELIKELSRQIVLQYGVDIINNENYPKMINKKQFIAMSRLIDKNKVLFGGNTSTKLNKIEPTILDATFEDECMQEEIFGPILPILTFDKLDEAINKVKSLPKPLALYVFSSKKENQDKVLESVDFGGGCVNDTIMHLANNHLGFGGVKTSGMGSYHGKNGFDTFTHYKSIVEKKTWLDMPIRYQPFNSLKNVLVKLFLK